MEKEKCKPYWKMDQREKNLKSTNLEMIIVKPLLNSIPNIYLCVCMHLDLDM